MTPEEIQVRSGYLFLTCSDAIETAKQRLVPLVTAFPSPPAPRWERALARELTLLFRYWATREIWERLESDEAGAKGLNLALLRRFTDDDKLHQDGSGLRYAELSTIDAEARELNRRMASALGVNPQWLADALQGAITGWRETVAGRTREALEVPVQ